MNSTARVFLILFVATFALFFFTLNFGMSFSQGLVKTFQNERSKLKEYIVELEEHMVELEEWNEKAMNLINEMNEHIQEHAK